PTISLGTAQIRATPGRTTQNRAAPVRTVPAQDGIEIEFCTVQGHITGATCAVASSDAAPCGATAVSTSTQNTGRAAHEQPGAGAYAPERTVPSERAKVVRALERRATSAISRATRRLSTG